MEAMMTRTLNVLRIFYAYFFPPLQIPRHIAVIPNGNRRLWKLLRFLYRLVGVEYTLKDAYLRGANVALNFVRWAERAGVHDVTFFGLSKENKAKRLEWEIDALLEGAIYFFDAAVERGYHLHPFGDFEAFAGVEKYKPLYDRLRKWRAMPISEGRIVIHVAAHYSGLPRHELAPLREAIRKDGLDVAWADLEQHLLSSGVPDIDLVIRTGSWRESRTSGLLPFQVVYAELCFVWVFWGMFKERHFWKALRWYSREQRNFGR